MGTLQVRLLLTYFVIIGVTLGLTALSLFLLLGGYRNSISFGNLEDVGRLVDSRARDAVRAPAGEEPVEGIDLLFVLRKFVEEGTVSADTAMAVVNGEGVVLVSASATPLAGQRVSDLGGRPVAVARVGDDAPTAKPRRCRVETVEGGALLCVYMPLTERLVAAFPGGQAAGLVVARPEASLGEVLGDLAPRLLFAGLIGVAAALVLGLVLAQSVAAPLRTIARAARSVSRGSYRQVPVTGPREVRDLAANFNRMTEEVERSQQTLRDFLANISHELKTPLTSIQGFSTAMLDGTIDDREGIERSAKIISDESARVLRLVEGLLDLSRIESGQVPMRQEEFALEELFVQASEVFALRAEEQGVRLELRPESRARVRGDFDRLEQVLTNLLDNAFRYTPKGGVVRVSGRDAGPGMVEVRVEDTGRGIPPEHLPHLFERFYRAAEGNGKGYGLGLAITREIVRAHGGEIRAMSEPGRGTVFAFTLPAAGR